MKLIAVSGSVCSGKTTLAKELAEKLDYEYIDVLGIVKSNPKVIESFDEILDTRNVDVDKLNDLLSSVFEENKNYVVDSHMSHFLPKVNVCVIMKCDLKVLKKRLTERGYSEKKIEENLQAEILDSCLIEALENKHSIVVVESTDGVDINSVISSVKDKL
jgi:adenylate kinase